jgi:hypothetical protein
MISLIIGEEFPPPRPLPVCQVEKKNDVKSERPQVRSPVVNVWLCNIRQLLKSVNIINKVVEAH